MRLWVTIALAVSLVPVFADTLRLRNGSVVTGTYLGGTARQVRFDTGDRIATFDVGEVSGIEFQPAEAAQAAPTPPPERTMVRREPPPAAVAPPPPTASPAAALGGIEVPAGSEIVVRMIDTVDSQQARIGQEFRASLDEPVMVGGQVVIPRNADVTIKLVEDKQASRLAGRTALTLDVVSVSVNGRPMDVHTRSVTETSSSRTKRTGALAGGGAALGAIIGGLAGGGKGAAVGAVSGAGAGTAASVATKGPSVRIPSETRLTFVLQDSVRI